jgi:hypothetical protein
VVQHESHGGGYQTTSGAYIAPNGSNMGGSITTGPDGKPSGGSVTGGTTFP